MLLGGDQCYIIILFLAIFRLMIIISKKFEQNTSIRLLWPLEFIFRLHLSSGLILLFNRII